MTIHSRFHSLLHSLGLEKSEFPGGVHPRDCKITAEQSSERCPLPPVLIIPLKQHIGEACSPIVSIGDHVLRGQKIAKAEAYVAAPVHAPTSGKVIKIEEHRIPHPSGLGLPCVFIEPDGLDEGDTSLCAIPDWKEIEPIELRERIRVSGIVGLGGAAFPTFIKLLRDNSHPIETVILNGVECEPYLTNDHRLMVETTQQVIEGMQILMHVVQAKQGIIAIEDNKPSAISAIQDYLHQHHLDIRLQVLPTRYPQGGEKQLIQSIIGKQIPVGKLPMHIGVLCQNIGTCKAIYDAVVLGKTLTERMVTVSGDATPQPKNLWVRIGTPMRFIFEQCALTHFESIQILHGGPMMGERMATPDIPVVKSSTGLLAMQQSTMQSVHQLEDPCIRCGHCSIVCPINLVPNLLADHCRNDQFEKAEDYQLFDCIECGCCSYVCPSNIPLVHYFRYGKGQVAQLTRERRFAEASKQRSELREQRIEREKAEKAARRQRVRTAQKPTPKKVESVTTTTDQIKPTGDQN